jgi:phosphoribosylaminoimidazole carboxylase (NCAIR synthetase)
MESKIEILIKESISLAENKFKADITTQEFERTKEEFKDLVQKGFAHERGYNLMSISDDKSISKVVFNSH